MAAEVMLALGEFQFSIETAAFQESTRSTGYRWASQERFGNGPAVQYTGLEDETMSLSGTIYPGFRGGLIQLDNLRALAVKHEPQQLMNGQGFLLGTWVITNVEEKQSEFLPGGVAQKVDFTLQLKRYDNELEQTSTSSAGYLGPEGPGAYVPDATPTQPWSSSKYGTETTPTQAGFGMGDGSNVYLTRIGDTLASIAARYYGTINGRVVEKLLGHNRLLANAGAVLPGGLKLELPQMSSIVSAAQAVRLWS